MRSYAVALMLIAFVALQSEASKKLSSRRRLTSAAKPGNGGACSKQCQPSHKCVQQTCEACVPLTCADLNCPAGTTCNELPGGPVCVPDILTCADIYCPAGTICNELPGGPDCVPDIPSCEGFFCRRGTNCYVRDASPICLPNTCEIRVCEEGLTCIDTPAGALCRKGQKSKGCGSKYCPRNSKCTETKEKGAHCIKI